jgi:hypothetical protein
MQRVRRSTWDVRRISQAMLERRRQLSDHSRKQEIFSILRHNVELALRSKQHNQSRSCQSERGATCSVVDICFRLEPSGLMFADLSLLISSLERCLSQKERCLKNNTELIDGLQQKKLQTIKPDLLSILVK